jgi:hypothetical protein
MAEAGALVRYDEMCRAITEAYIVDEVKQIRDQATALEHYARLAHNIEAERQCAQIRLRAERRWGELYEKQGKARGNRNDGEFGGRISPPPNNAKTLANMGVSKQQSSDWQKLADIPEPQFEEALAAPGIPTTASLLDAFRAAKAVTSEALALCWQVKQLYKLSPADPAIIIPALTPRMRDALREELPDAIDFLHAVEDQIFSR